MDFQLMDKLNMTAFSLKEYVDQQFSFIVKLITKICFVINSNKINLY